MMRALYSGVSGLKTHQTKFDVIGNNISNVNTVGFKASSVAFSDVFYQTMQGASGANANTGAAGQNAMQVGIGVDVGSITTSITKQGSTQRTDNALDVMINGDGFFVVNKGGQNYFTKAGNFKVDGAGNLATDSGANVMGWQVDPKDPTKTVADKVSKLKVMTPENMTSEPEATTKAYVTGNIDSKDQQLENGKIVIVPFYDQTGQKYSISMKVQQPPSVGGSISDSVNKYQVTVVDITDVKGKSILVKEKPGVDGAPSTYEASGVKFSFAGTEAAIAANTDGTPKMTTNPTATLSFDGPTGHFKSIAGASGGDPSATNNKSVDFKVSATPDTFKTISIDFSTLTQFAQNETSSLKGYNGDTDGLHTGRQKGNMNGVSIDSSGKMSASYDNGAKKLIGQIAVATFANPAGLEAVGDNMFATTLNSGEFDGIGQDPTVGGKGLTPGALEMSNVDLAAQFTDMITTQRGYQANSRIITTADTLLEELINMKR
jgi:flagellar hook protein FlgE